MTDSNEMTAAMADEDGGAASAGIPGRASEPRGPGVYEDALDLVRQCRPLWEAIGRHDKDLARQLRKAVTAVPPNFAEGEHRKGGHRRERWGTAYGSCREVKALLDTAEAAGYLSRRRIEGSWRTADSVCARLFRLKEGR